MQSDMSDMYYMHIAANHQLIHEHRKTISTQDGKREGRKRRNDCKKEFRRDK